MSLASGTRLGPYEILAPIGAGGMGEVYRATDTKLGLQVAIKVIPESFAQDLDRMARFVVISPDGKHIGYHEVSAETGRDLWTPPLDTADPDHPKAGKPVPFLRTPANEVVPMFSPDGRWIAYRSDESGPNEIYVRPFPGPGGKWQISVGGGLYAFWSKNRHELFYETPDNRIMVLDYTAEGNSFVRGKPRFWTETRVFFPGVGNMDLAPDGKRFVVFPLPEAPAGDKNAVHVTFILNFFAS